MPSSSVYAARTTGASSGWRMCPTTTAPVPPGPTPPNTTRLLPTATADACTTGAGSAFVRNTVPAPSPYSSSGATCTASSAICVPHARPLDPPSTYTKRPRRPLHPAAHPPHTFDASPYPDAFALPAWCSAFV